MNQLTQSLEREGSSRFAFLTPPSVARWAAIPLQPIVVAGTLLLDLLFQPLQTGIPRSTLSKIKQLKIIQLPTIRHFPKPRHPTVASNHLFSLCCMWPL